MIRVLGFDSQQGLGIFLFTTASRMVLGPTQPPIQWVPGALSLGVKQPRHKADHLPSSAKVKNAWNYTSTPQYTFMTWCSVKKKAQGQFYLLHSPFTESLNHFHETEAFLAHEQNCIAGCPGTTGLVWTENKHKDLLLLPPPYLAHHQQNNCHVI
jgi:hypothetical protein